MTKWYNQYRNMTIINYIMVASPLLPLSVILAFCFQENFSEESIWILIAIIILTPIDMVFTLTFLKKKMVPSGPVFVRVVEKISISDIELCVEEVIRNNNLTASKMANIARESSHPKTNLFEYRIVGKDIVVELYNIEFENATMLGLRYKLDSDLLTTFKNGLDLKIEDRIKTKYSTM